jgi:hypothetical protein
MNRTMTLRIANMIGAAGILLTAAVGVARAGDIEDVRDLFELQVQAENAHDIAKFGAVIAPGTREYANAVTLVSRAGKFVGREAVLQRLEGYFKGTWKLDPDWGQLTVTKIGHDTMHLLAPTKITLGASGKDPQTLSFFVNEVAIRTPEGWRFTTIIPVLTQ